ncbi:hypothetical protein M885DRAFT_224323 [Pelagophyceae sp. CCMP2097]|nr:hypothetical protein M885DRAFT_224323 [Pelagophyceae sp. CCMP2097]
MLFRVAVQSTERFMSVEWTFGAGYGSGLEVRTRFILSGIFVLTAPSIFLFDLKLVVRSFSWALIMIRSPGCLKVRAPQGFLYVPWYFRVKHRQLRMLFRNCSPTLEAERNGSLRPVVGRGVCSPPRGSLSLPRTPARRAPGPSYAPAGAHATNITNAGLRSRRLWRLIYTRVVNFGPKRQPDGPIEAEMVLSKRIAGSQGRRGRTLELGGRVRQGQG